jgi:hypothetical protein
MCETPSNTNAKVQQRQAAINQAYAMPKGRRALAWNFGYMV